MKCKTYINNNNLTVYPPVIQIVAPLMRQLNQELHIESIPHPKSYEPQFQKARKTFVGISKEEIANATLEKLWQIHDFQAYEPCKNYGNHSTLLELKIEIAKKKIQNCSLCGHECNVNRYKERGKCNLKDISFYEYWGELIGEETPINPAAGIALYACSFNCKFCHAHDYLNVNQGIRLGKILNLELWDEIDYEQCQTIEFSAAGDPIPNLLSILETLNSAPEEMNHQIIWSSNSYGTKETWKVLNNLIDIYLIDLKFGNDNCALSLAGCEKHNEFAKETLHCLSRSSGKVIIRWLLLPGHLECCG
ncbi:MAG: 4Fe-4S cluster-binding domain-containing protein, partial [Candidatus Edwardsbacteria bacterium]